MLLSPISLKNNDKKTGLQLIFNKSSIEIFIKMKSLKKKKGTIFIKLKGLTYLHAFILFNRSLFLLQ